MKTIISQFCSSLTWRNVTAVFDMLEMTSSSSSPTPSVGLDTIDTSLSDITVLENINSSNRSSRNMEDSLQHIPDLIPRTFIKKSRENNNKDLEIKGNETKKLESVILLSMLLATVVALYLFPQEWLSRMFTLSGIIRTVPPYHYYFSPSKHLLAVETMWFLV